MFTRTGHGAIATIFILLLVLAAVGMTESTGWVVAFFGLLTGLILLRIDQSICNLADKFPDGPPPLPPERKREP